MRSEITEIYQNLSIDDQLGYILYILSACHAFWNVSKFGCKIEVTSKFCKIDVKSQSSETMSKFCLLKFYKMLTKTETRERERERHTYTHTHKRQTERDTQGHSESIFLGFLKEVLFYFS